MKEKAWDTQANDHPIRQQVRALCGTYSLSATFSEDTGALETLKTPGLIAIKCVLNKDNKPVGIGHGSSVISRINKGVERSIFGCLNGAMMSAVNSACKTLDSLRLQEAEKLPATAKDIVDEQITDKQQSLLSELIYDRIQNEGEREKWLSQMQTLTKADAGELISNLLAAPRR